jgi:uncharacterized protein (DUF362 family)
VHSHRVTRRELLQQAAAAALVGGGICGCRQHCVRLTACSPTAINASHASSTPVLLGLFPKEGGSTPEDAVRCVCREIDWSWLSRGDSVFVKLASNSPVPHPATTSPCAVRALVAELRARGAGQILVGDQSGVEYVRLACGGRRFAGTREVTTQNGLYDAIVESGATPHFFDDQGYDDGYFEAAAPFALHWQPAPYLARVIQEVDHIIYLPRLSSHCLAGYTIGHKIAVGWLRDDSRFQLHFEAGTFHAKFVELSYLPEISRRLRLVLTLAESVLLDAGPDRGTHAQADSCIVIASPSIANHDALAAAVLTHIDAQVPPGLNVVQPPYGALSNSANWAFVSWYVRTRTHIPWGLPDAWQYQRLPTHHFKQGLECDLALSRAYDILGGMPRSIPVHLLGEQPNGKFRGFLASHDNGRFCL